MELPSELVQSVIDKVIKEHGFVKYHLNWSEGTKKGDNFMGILHKIKVTGKKQNGDDASLNLFCKVPHDTEVMREEFKLNESFQREILMYGEILPEFEKLQEEKGVKNNYIMYPKCYAASSKDLEEYIIMEDLSSQGFLLFDRRNPLDFDHVKLVMKELGKFHSLSFALKTQKPGVFVKYDGRFPELIIRDPFEGAIKNFVETFLKSAVDTLEFEGIYKERWENFHQNYLKLMRFSYDGKSAEPYSVINHGDCWINNILFKYENGKPVEIRFIDFQLSRYTSVAPDIAFLNFCCTDKAFRDQYYKSLLVIYYDSLSSSLRDLGSDPEKVFPRSAFDDQMKTFGLTGLGVGVLDIPMIVSSPEDAQSMEEMMNDASGMTQNKSKEAVKQRLTECVMDMVDLGYI